jgi:hypothetical protein
MPIGAPINYTYNMALWKNVLAEEGRGICDLFFRSGMVKKELQNG